MVLRVFCRLLLLSALLLVLRVAGAAAASRPNIAPIARALAPAAATYSIVDVGRPAPATYPSSEPVGFNDAGEIFGVGLRSAKSDRYSYATDTDCLVWTGAKFIDLTPSLTFQACTPYAMSQAAPATGSVRVVGSFTDIHHMVEANETGSNLDAFSATVEASGAFSFLPYFDHQPAVLQGVNATGTAIGRSFNRTNSNALFVTVPPEGLAWLQPACVTFSAGCLQTLTSIYEHEIGNEPSAQCPFGGCTVNDAGAVLGFDVLANAYAVYAGSPATVTDLPLPLTNSYVVGMNDARQILYFAEATGVVPLVYDMASGTSVSIPPVAGKSCYNYFPISLSNSGEVLGFTSRCASGDFYWTWDPSNGTRDLNAALPSTAFKMTPLAVNDSGQILVSLAPATGPAHWGRLVPPGSPTKAHTGRRGVLTLSAGTALSQAATRAPLRPPHDRPGIRPGWRVRAAAAPAYTIHVIGAPPGYAFSEPGGFNNTGQIFGVANTRTGGGSGNASDCLVWTGSAFKRLPLPAGTDDCAATGIDDANASGEYEIVGYTTQAYAGGNRAFAVLAAGGSFERTTIYYPYSPSVMVGVNASEIALATAPFQRDTAADYQGQLYYTVTAAANSLTQLQPLAIPGGPAFHFLIPTYSTPCPFGGCAINDRNEVLGYDLLTQNVNGATAAIYTIGAPASLVHLPIQDFGSLGNFPVAFSNANQLVYYSPAYKTALLYDIGTGVRTIVPVSAPGCGSGIAMPISLNDRGEVLGIDECSTFNVYWTWDAVHGTQYLDGLPSTPYTMYPLGVNDAGQILVWLTTATTDAWGTLDPVASGALKTIRR